MKIIDVKYIPTLPDEQLPLIACLGKSFIPSTQRTYVSCIHASHFVFKAVML